ncbi:MAG: class I SAM-dependent methyltransferase [Candidatus Didemnitutus sp.]|nr:class I SAM-dependent methyltransferase [Candidatus Didemnitutus sp.]
MSFDLLAPHYGWMERVLAGRLLQRARTAWIDRLADRERLLIAGVGHGRSLHELLPRHRRLRVTCVDASAGMLREAENRARRARLDLSRIQFIHACLPEWRAEAGAFDAIATHFFLDCFAPRELSAVVAGLADAAAPDAVWLVTDFAVPERGWTRHRARAVHALMYAFFRVATRLPARRLTPPDDLLAAQGFALGGRRTFSRGLLQADWWRRPRAA